MTMCVRALTAVSIGVAASNGSAAAGGIHSQRIGSATAVFALAETARQRGDIPTAEKMLGALLGDPSDMVRAEARFRLAKLLAANGKRAEAAVLLRRVVDAHPKAVPARLELAGLLQQIGDEKSALRELRALGTLDLPPNVARFVDRMSASLQASRSLSFQLELGLAPDTNINRATRSDTLGTVFGDFTLDKQSRAKSGVGAAVRGFVQGRLPVSNDVNLAAHASLDTNLYRHRQFDAVTLEVAGGPEFRLGPARVAAEAGFGQSWYGLKPYQRTLRLSSSARMRVGAVSQLRLDGAARWSDNAFNDLEDGRGMSAALRYERALSPELTVGLGVGVDRFRAQDDAYSTRSWSVGVTAYRDIGRTSVELGVDIGRLKADDRLEILPAAREDRLTRLHAGAVFRQLTVGGFAPTLRIVAERNRSTIEFHDYKRTRTEFGITRAF
jgi:tetratricopeptide (TPR) repeat protein